MKRLPIFIPVLAVLVCLLVLAQPMMPKGDAGAYDLDTFGRLPVSAGGRTKPLDSVARNSLLIVSDRQTAVLDGNRVPAMRWLLDVMARPIEAGAYEVFRVDHPNVKDLIGNPPKNRKRFSFDYIITHIDTLQEQAVLADKAKPKQRTPYQKHLMELFDHLTLYVNLRDWQTPYSVPPLAEGEQWRPLVKELHAPHEGHDTHADPGPAAASLANILLAYQTQDPATFNAEVKQYASMLDQQMPEVTRKARFEVFFNKLQPFYQGMMLYVLAFLLGAGSLLAVNAKSGTLAKALGRAAVVVVALTFCLHTFGLAARIYMQGYAPVTNLYSSAVFIGWFCVFMGLFMEWLFKNGLSAAMSAVIGFVTLIIAHNLADGDTMQMMQAVLDSNFWLATHVTAITVGYSATFMAGLIGIFYIIAGVYTERLDAQLAKTMGKMIYGTIAFALLFSFVGTVLGGIWADQSWGRFWGWDTKENGAVLIVLMTALILHARWGGMIKTRGMAVLAVFGNIITAWSWFGTNMLGVGLHSYGFMEQGVVWLLVFVASQLAIMTAGIIPVSKWKSFSSKMPSNRA
jgi:ABC-type transport system involved in cytochrome c biogenesis permease subunit